MPRKGYSPGQRDKNGEQELNFCFQILDYIEESLIKAAVCGNSFLDGDVGDVGTFEDGNATPLLLVDHVDGVEAVTLPQDAIEGRGRAATLGVAEVDGAGLEAGLLFNKLRQGLADAGQTRMAEGIDLTGA